MKRIAVCIPTRQDQNEPGTLSYPLISLAFQSYHDFTIYIRDEGQRDAYADRQFRLVLNLLAMKGIDVRYWRTMERKGAGFARRSLFESVQHNEPYILWLDDDMLIEPDAVSRLIEVIESDPKRGFVQGTKCELDPFRTYHNDINVLNTQTDSSEPIQIWFGDTALLLMRTEALRQINWDILTRYQLDGLTGEDVSMSLMVAQNYEGWGVPNARGWHLSPALERWLWEPPSDALQIELLKNEVDAEILCKALPYLAPFIEKSPTSERMQDGIKNDKKEV